LVFLATLPANAGPLAGAKTCGPYVKRAPSTLGSSGSGMVSTAIAAKELADLRDALICLINAERTSTGKQALARNRQFDMAALGHTSEAQRLKWWGSSNPHVHPDKGPRDAGQAISQRIRDAGYCPAGATRVSEIAFNWAGLGTTENPGGPTPAGAVNWWMNISKSGHREAILDPSIKEIGVGFSGQTADKNIPPQQYMGTYVVNFGACPTSVAPSSAEGAAPERRPADIILQDKAKVLVRP
jgi:uncharacterized protein YkwD